MYPFSMYSLIHFVSCKHLNNSAIVKIQNISVPPRYRTFHSFSKSVSSTTIPVILEPSLSSYRTVLPVLEFHIYGIIYDVSFWRLASFIQHNVSEICP